MKKNKFIRTLVVFTMLIVFAISITPAVVFHNWFAEHSDAVTKYKVTDGEQFGHVTFKCGCDHLVAASPFTHPADIFFAYDEHRYQLKEFYLLVTYISPHAHTQPLRGPPTV